MSFIRGMRRKRNVALAGMALFATAGTALVLSPEAHATTQGTSTQTVTFVPTGVLTITAPALGLQSQVGSSFSLPLGSVVVTDSLADSSDWSASVAASNCFMPTSLTGVSSASGTIPASALSLNPSGTGTATSVAPTVSLDANTSNIASAHVPAGSTAFSDPSSTGSIGGWTYGSPGVTLASTNAYSTTNNDAVANNGTYTFSPSLSVSTSGSNFLGVANATYTCSLQYTVTG